MAIQRTSLAKRIARFTTCRSSTSAKASPQSGDLLQGTGLQQWPGHCAPTRQRSLSHDRADNYGDVAPGQRAFEESRSIDLTKERMRNASCSSTRAWPKASNFCAGRKDGEKLAKQLDRDLRPRQRADRWRPRELNERFGFAATGQRPDPVHRRTITSLKTSGKSTMRPRSTGLEQPRLIQQFQKQMPELWLCELSGIQGKPIPQGLHTPFLLSIMRAMSHTTYDPRTPPALCHRPGHRSVFRIRQGTHSGRTSVEAFLRNPFHVPARRTSHTVIR